MVAERERIEPREEPTRIGGIGYPDEVIRALLERRLVVFAGAGVSMDAPTSLPNFDGLVSEFESSSVQERDPRETIDQYLGRLKSKHGVRVHAEVARLLSLGEPQPNANHKNLLKLFGSDGYVRLVTTNFDLMFEESAVSLGWKVKSYTAPELPQQALDFRGIVHLHGSMDDKASMILTKGDFGRAYTTPGWATAFLADIVQSYTVLFVGYSGNDLLLDYLLTAISEASASSLYMLRRQDDAPIDSQSGIMVVEYPSKSRDDHSQLSRSLQQQGHLFYLDKGELRESIEAAAGSPGFDWESNEETIRVALRRRDTTRFFATAATDVSWVRWLENEGYLTSLFNDSALTPSAEILAGLVARLCIRDDPAYLLSLLERRCFVMSDVLWQEVAFAIHQNETRDVSLAQWLTILLQHPIEHMEGFSLSLLAEACERENDTEALLHLYEFLVTPRRVGSQHGWSGVDEYVKITEDTVRQSGGSLALHHCANMLGTQDAGILRQALEIGIRSFEQRHKLLRVWGKSTDDCDPWSTVYDPINRPDGREQPEGFDLLCVETRRQIHTVIKSSGDYAHDLVRRLVTSPAPILRRLAVDAIRVRDDMDAEAKAEWLMGRTRVEDRELSSEISRLLERIFSDLSDANQDRIVKWLLDGEARQSSDEEVVAAKKSRWLRLLKRSDPNSESVGKELQSLRRNSREAYARPYPERPVSISHAGFIHHPEPFTVDQLLAAPAGAWVEDLISWKPAGRRIWDDERHGLLTNAQSACVRNFGWSKDLARGLIDRRNSSTDLWGPILMAWRDESCAVTDWSSVLDALNFVVGQNSLSRDIAWALGRVAKESQALEQLERANRLAAAMWRENSDDAEGWLSSGLLYASWNSAAGLIPMYWVEVAKRLIDSSVASEQLAAELRREVSEILRPGSQQSTVGKVTLGAWFHVFYRLDEDWAKNELVPMFGDSQDGFEAAWEGFLWTFQGTLWMPNEMLGYVEGAIANRQRIDTEHGVGVARFVSYLCCTRESKQAHHLFRVLCNTADDAQSLDDDIADFVIGVRSLLRRMDVQRRTKLWNSWLREHLTRRRNSLPSGLVDGEVWELLMLIPVMLPAAREIVDVLTEFPADKSERNTFGMIFYRVDVDDFPNEYAKLMLYFDQYELNWWQWNHNKEHLDKLIANEAVPLDQRKRLKELKAKHKIE